MSNRVLAICPEYDIVTRYLSHYLNKTIDYAIQNGYDVTQLWTNYANKSSFEEYSTSFNPTATIFCAHGSPIGIYDASINPIVERGLNENYLSGSVVFAISCQTGKELAQSAIDSNAKAYTGFRDDLIFLVNTSVPIGRDDRALPVMDTWITTQLLSALEGKTKNRIYSDVIDRKKQWIDHFVDGDGKNEWWADDEIRVLNWNASNFVALGQEDVVVGKPINQIGNLVKLGVVEGIGAGALVLSSIVGYYLWRRYKK